MAKIILFDIDGTLVLTGGAGGRAMARAFEEQFGVASGFDSIPMLGRTDAAILGDAAARHGVVLEPPILSQFRERYLGHLSAELPKPGPRKGVMPGVRELLDALVAKDDVHVALLTGNYERAARAKLEYFDLWRYFTCGAFGDDTRDRNLLLPKAVAEVCASGGPKVAPSDVVVVGDTPLDVLCAATSGARSLAVATGSHDADALRAAGADVVMNELSDTPVVLEWLMGKS